MLNKSVVLVHGILVVPNGQREMLRSVALLQLIRIVTACHVPALYSGSSFASCPLSKLN